MTHRISRRSMLRATATSAGALALYSMLERRALAGATAPTRVIFWYVPEGAAQQAFWPGHGPGALTINPSASVGGGLTPLSQGQSIDGYRSAQMGTYCIQPLEPHVADLTLVSGLQNFGVAGNDEPHATVVAGALTGGRPNEGSLDQVLGFHLQGNAPFHAIFSSLYGEHVNIGVNPSYACPFRTITGASASPTWNPVTTFNQVFPSGLDGNISNGPDHRLVSRLAVLGSVRSRLEAVRCKGGAAAQERVETYFSSIEQVEQETQGLIDTGDISVDVTVDIPEDWTQIDDNNKYWHNPANFPTMAKIQIDTTVAALATDRTRVSLMQFSASGTDNGISGDHYKFIGLSDLENGDVNDHYLGHDPNATRRRNQARIFRWYYQQLAYLIDRLKSIRKRTGPRCSTTR